MATWEAGRNAVEILTTRSPGCERDAVTFELGKLGADLTLAIERWEVAGDVDGLRAARAGMRWYRRRHPD